MNRTRGILAVIGLVLSACTTPAAVTPEARESPSASVAATQSPEQSETPRASEVQPSADSSERIPAGALVHARVHGLQVRADPGLEAEPLMSLVAGQRLRVTDGPRDVDGYRWYEVAMLPSEGVGWVASGGDGAQWLTVVENGDLALAWGRAVSNLDLSNETSRPLLELDAGWEAYGPTWSPEGDRLAVAELVVDEDLQCVREARIRTVDLAGRHSAVTSPPQGWYDSAPIWAPDGASVAFTRASSTCRSDIHRTDLFVVPADGGAERLVVEDVIAPTWSPLGTMFAFLRFNGDPTDVPGDLRGPEIWTVATDGTGLRRLGGRADIAGERERLADRVAWAPDGSLLAYSRAVGAELSSTEIDVIDLDGRIRSVTTVQGEVRDLTWLPGTAELAYVEGRTGATAVVVVSLDGGEAARFELTDGVPDALVISPDGEALAWRIQGSPQLVVQPVDGSPHRLIDGVEATSIAWRASLSE